MNDEILPAFSGSPWLYTTPTKDIVAWRRLHLSALLLQRRILKCNNINIYWGFSFLTPIKFCQEALLLFKLRSSVFATLKCKSTGSLPHILS